jgi:multiple sugar transport system permease protein
VAALGADPARAVRAGVRDVRRLSGRYGLWLARHPASYEKLFDDPCSSGRILNTLAFLVLAINLKMIVALILSGFFVVARTWIKWLSLLFILPWAVPSIPTILSIRFMLNPEWGLINSLIFRLHRRRRTQLAQRSLPRAGDRDARPHLEIAAVLDADPDRRAGSRSRRALRGASVDGATAGRNSASSRGRDAHALPHVHDPVDDLHDGRLQQRLPADGRRPADLTHVLATLGIRYLRLDEVDMSMAAIVVALPAVLPLVYFMMKRSRNEPPELTAFASAPGGGGLPWGGPAGGRL